MSRLGAVLRVSLLAALPLWIGSPEVWAAGTPGLPNIAIDSSGNFYVASTSPTAHLMVNQYGPTGTPGFALDLGTGTRLDAITTDLYGAIYVAYTVMGGGGTLKVSKYNSNGTLAYATVDFGATNRLEGIMTDGAGQLYVAWTSDISNLFVNKYESGGNRVYVLDEGVGSQLNGMAVDSGDNLYACLTNSSANLILTRYNATGTQTYAQGLGVGGQFNALFPDGGGNVFVSWVSAAAHLLVEKYNIAGGQTFSVDLGASSRQNAMTVDISNNVYVAWTSVSDHLFVNKYSSGGALSASIDQGVASQASFLAVDPILNYFISYVSSTGHLIINKYNSSNVAATPVDLGAGTQLNSMFADVGGALYTLITSTNGHLMAKRYDSSANLTYTVDLGAGSQLNGATVDGSSNLYLEYTSSAGHLLAGKYTFTGVSTYTADLGVGTRSSGAPTNVNGNLVDPGGNVYLTSTDSGGNQTVTKYNPGGGILHSRAGTAYSKALTAVDDFGNSYIASLNSNLVLEKRNAAGTTVYSISLGAGGQPLALSVDPAGDAYIGWADAGGTVTFTKYDPAGAVGYTLALGTGTTLSAVSVDAAGFAYIGSTTAGGVASLKKIDPAGGTGYSLSLGASSQVAALLIDSGGNAFLGYYDNLGTLNFNKYNAHGDAVYSVFPGTGSRVAGLAADTAGMLYLAYIDSFGTLQFIKRDAGGAPIFTFSLGNGYYVSGLSVDSAGNAYLGYTDASSVLHVNKYESGGSVLYGMSLGVGTRLGFLSSDSAGNAYAAYTDSAGVLTFAKYNAAGGVAFTAGLGSGSQLMAAASDSAGNSYVGYANSGDALFFTRYNAAGGVVYTLPLGTGSRLALTGASLRTRNTPDAAQVAAGGSIGFTLGTTNSAVAGGPLAMGVTLGDALPAGLGINWSISPAYTGQGRCAITGPVGNQVIRCDLGGLMPQATMTVHVTSATNGSSCGNYINYATSTATNGTLTQLGASVAVCGTGLSITKTHTGNFTQGQTGATYTLTVSNAVGAVATSGTVTVTETVPSGLTLVSMAGTGWTCGGITCTRNDALAAGQSYPSITVTVNVAVNATSPQVNTAAVSGGGGGVVGTTDSTVITSLGCSYVVTPLFAAIPSGGGTGNISVTAPAGCAWTATGGTSWLTITSGSAGSGNGTVGYSGVPNSTVFLRAVNLSVAGQSVNISQQPPVATNTEAFVRQLYLDILNRPAETTGLNTWVGWIDTGVFTRAQVAAQFFQSPEFALSGSYITKLYLAIFLRDPDYGGWNGWFAYLRAGHSQTEILNQFLGSQEFQQRYGSLDNTAFVTLVYNNVLKRAPDTAGLNQWVAWLNSGAYTRADVMNGFITSQEFEIRIRNRVYANMLYIAFLRRVGETAGLDGWTNWLADGTFTLDQEVSGFITSQEYLLRF